MKPTFTKSLFWMSLAFAVASCALILLFSGCQNPKPLSSFERHFLNEETNYVPVLHVVTNVVPVYQTNMVTVLQTNQVGQTVLHTNEVVETVWHTNVVINTTTNEEYKVTPNGTATAITQVGGTVGNLFGAGGLVSTALAGVFGIWASIRSSRRYDTAAVLAQNVQQLRAFVQALPNGATYDTALTNFMQTHQADAGVLNQVLTLIQSEVKNSDAQFAAQSVIATINALSQTPPIATPPAAAVKV